MVHSKVKCWLPYGRPSASHLEYSKLLITCVDYLVCKLPVHNSVIFLNLIS